MKRFFGSFLAAALCFASTGGAFAAPGINIKAVKGFNTEVEVDVPEVAIDACDAAGQKALSITIPNGSISLDKACPQLPRLTAMVMVDPFKNPIFRVKPVQSEVIDLDARVVPSKGNITRNIDPNNVPFEYGDIYGQDRWYPADNELVALSEPFIMRDIRGVRLLVNPVQYNPVQNKLRVHRRLNISIVGGTASTNVVRSAQRISSYYEPIYRSVFANFDKAATRLPRLEENGRLLVITADAFADAMGPFVAWKKKCGLDVALVKMSEVGKTAVDIKNYIQADYNKGGLTHIMLVGDAEQVPTLKGVKENADSDPCYTKLAGDDHVPDCIISRLSATTPEAVAYQVAKFVNYEQFPSTGADAAWYNKAMGIASNQGNPTDFVRAGWIRDALLKWLFKSVDEIYDPKATKAMVAAGINEGRSLINYIGHGSNTTWVTTGFGNADCGALKNGWKLPVIWSVACVNGNFVGKECFAEAFMKAGTIEDPKGAAAIFAASTNMEWVPPCDVQKEINDNYTVNELYKTVGGLAFNGVMKGLEIYGTDPKKSGVMMFEQWHLFGDGTMLARFKAPTAVTVAVETAKAEERINLTAKVTDAEGKPVSNARVTFYTERVENAQVGTTNEQGIANLSMPLVRNDGGYVTVIGADMVPVVDQKVQF
ncbi:MAG: Gingipain R2 precursor [bacterium ADurb.Bin374]|nr:MAG: Gingipain R2 precursor [bacterium ADurb.Bin374]